MSFARFLSGELIAAVLIGLVLIACGAWIFWRETGPASIEWGKVVQFGITADGEGNHPTVIVTAADGRLTELKTTQPILLGCSPGSRIRLVRRSNSLNVDPRGCR